MTRMENLETDLEEQARKDARYHAAMASIQRRKLYQERQGYAVMSAVMGYGEGALGNGVFGKISQAAKIFMITFACVVPVVLVWSYLL